MSNIPDDWQSQHDFDMDGIRRIIGDIDGPDDGQMHYRVVCEVSEDLSNDEAGAVARLIVAAPKLLDVLIKTKQEMWLGARHQWTMSDFKNWAIVQEIDAVLTLADGKAR